MEAVTMTDIKWAFTADYLETCSCTHACPCNFIGVPSDGICEALVAYHIRTGKYGDVALDGMDFVIAWAWPNAIHEGNGTAAFFITDRASSDQRKALSEIATGKAGGKGPFAVFATTYTTVHDPKFVPVEIVVDGFNSRFGVLGILDVVLQGFTDPVDGTPGNPKKLVNDRPGLIFDWAYVAMTKIMKVFGGGLKFDHSGRNAFHTVVEYAEA
jgi:hypothetical protein